MARRDINERKERVETDEGEFYEALPSVEAPLYRPYAEEDLEIDRDDTGLSGWAILGLVLLGLLLLLLITGNIFQ